MRFWEWVLKADRQIDLATASLDQLREHGCHPRCSSWATLGATGHLRWEGYHQRRWRTSVLAFRSVAGRLMGLRGRKETRSVGWMRAELADKLFRFLMMELQPTILPPPPGYRAPSPPGFGIGVGFRAASPTGLHLTKSTYAGIRLVVPPLLAGMSARWCDRVERHIRRGANPEAVFAIDSFWLDAFGSLVVDDLTPRVCDVCGAPLGITPGGRIPRAGKCRNARTRTGTPDRRKIRGC